MKRLRWKNDLVQNAEEKLSLDPIQLPSRIKYVFNLPSILPLTHHVWTFYSLDALPDYMYRRYLVRGTLQPQKSILIGPKKYGEVMGYHLIMPLVRSPEPGSGAPSTSTPSTVLISLGFVSNEAAGSYRSLASSSATSSSWSSPEKRERPKFNENETVIEGLIPAPQMPNWFTPENKPDQGEWVWADVRAMAQYAGGEGGNVVPLLMEEIFGSYSLLGLR